SRVINSRSAWRKLYASWIVEARQVEMDAEDEENVLELPDPPAPGRSARWLPCPLSRLFGGTIAKPPQPRSRRALTEEERLMELLGAEHSDEEPDDGELEGPGDDYDE
ncbi:hypothetical protein B0H13DRAFT_1546005, partial [Mycena leptocephala]